mmetsp:Transcript_9571/g.22026  ORF Transcript_9571/g.22026 Transcript_9571/m.22026 type:complete len:93 (-) Transcript_9571:152-430(-)
MFALLVGLVGTQSLTWGSAADEVATLEPHTIKKDTEKNFCTLCMHIDTSFGIGGCRTEFYTNANLKKCGIDVGGGKGGDKKAKDAAKDATKK